MNTAADLLPALGRQGFAALPDVETAVEHVVGLNAQTPRGPSLGLLARVRGFEQDDLDAGLRDYALVKANLMRGTVHLVTARQFRRWRRALQPALVRVVKQFCPGLLDRIDPEALIGRGSELLAERDGLTRAEIGRALAPTFPDADPADLGFAVRMLAPVVQVADPSVWRPGRTRYVLAERVLGPGLDEPGAGLVDLLSDHLRCFGPATAADATYFTGLTGVAAELRELGDRVGGTARAPLLDLPPPAQEVPDAVVLPEYDNVLLAHRDGAPASARKRLIPSTAGLMRGAIVSGGALVGSWGKGEDGLPQLDPGSDLGESATDAFTQVRDWYARTDAALR